MADPKYVQDFIAEMMPYAVAVGDQYGIDPVTIITQAAVETGWGREVAGNNYFGVKSHGKPGGQNIATHEEVNGQRISTTDSFRKYGSLAESVADYGKFLSENPRYTEALKQTGPGELQGIAAAGYATDSSYADLTRDVAGMVQRNIQPLPPGSLPEVATALSTVPTPRNAPVPVTPSIDMAMMRRGAAPSQLIPDTFASLSKPGRNLGDEIGMSAIPGGKQSQPMFDAAYDERVGSMRLTRQPVQGINVGSSKPPAPIPAMPSPQLAAKRATDPKLQAALNARYPAQLPPLPPPSGQAPATRQVATTSIRPSASDLVRGNPMQTMERATTISSIPTRPQVSASDLARGRSGISTIASIPTTGFPTTEQIVAGSGFRPPPAIPDRLMAGEPGLPELYGNGGVAGVGTRAVAPTPFTRPQSFPTQFAAAPRIAPVPFQRPTGVGTQLSVRPMPPMPIVRPGIGGPARIAPRPMPASMRPLAGAPQIRTPLSSLTFAQNAVNRSGDDSVGSQADAAAARSSGEGGRNRRY